MKQLHNTISLRFYALTIVMFIISACTSTPAEPTDAPFVCDDTLGCVTIAPDEAIQLGSLQVLSGNPAPLGMTQDQTIQLAISERTIFGHSIEVMSVDTLCSSEGGGNAALRLVANPQLVGVLGTTCSGAAVGALPTISDAGLVMISGLNTAPSLTSTLGEEGSDHKPGYFRVIPTGVAFASIAADYIFNELGITKAASINDGDAFSAGIAQVFRTQFTNLGGEIVGDLAISKGDENMGPLLEALVLSEAESVFIPIFQPEADFIINQGAEIEELEDVQFIAMESLFVQSFIDAVGSNGNGMYFLTATVADTPEIVELRENYEAMFGDAPQHSAYVYAYDAANMLLDAIEAVAIQNDDGTLHIGRQALRDAVAGTTNYEGITGMLNCDEFGDCSGATLLVVQMEDATLGREAVLDNVIKSYTLGQ
ncbi:MAG: branched-chain amino acid ABC transporter substrate-binding protein [Anaerolineae bacterium]|nr:branched-chain amino acid ABC transporter substrate-binding protein [Anaerolineae bacterium]MDQ7037317.1 branched-chain amino acid ABC transporter substrate-binding protein [Anaerolineae bacterium]